MARTGLAQIDSLLSGATTGALTAANSAAETVGFIQDLLIGHDFKGLPGVLRADRGTFGPRTTDALREFQTAHGLPVTGGLDAATLRAFVAVEWPRPIACRGYVSLVLDIVFSGMVRLVSLTSQFEGAGLFTAINRNTDGAGLSCGLIQWAQKPRRLNELLGGFESLEPALFRRIFGAGDAALAQRLVDHTGKTNGGVDTSGATTDPQFDLIAAPWDARFIEAGRRTELQRAQLDLAVSAFTNSFSRLQVHAPQVR